MINYYNRKTGNTLKSISSGFIRNILFILPAFLVFLASCSDNPSKIGIGLLPDGDFVDISTTDTIGVKAFTMYDEATITTGSSTMLSGEVEDIFFGSTKCDFVTQLRVISVWPDKGFVVDSTYLYFKTSAVSGDTTGDHYVRILEIGNELTDSTDYFSNQAPDTVKLLGQYLLPALRTDTINVVEFRIDNWIGEYLLRDTSVFDTATHFYTRFFKGIYFGLKNGGDNPMLVSMNDASSPLEIVVWYKDKVVKTKRSYTFRATERAVNYNRYEHDFTTADPDKQIEHINDMFLSPKAYLQGYKGVFVRLDLPSLESFRDIPRLAVNKARLHVPVLIDGVNFLDKTMPSQIYLRYRNNEGKLFLLPDLAHDKSFLDGTYYKETDTYVFNIASFVQQYLDGDITDPSVEMYLPSGTDKNIIFNVNDSDPTVRFEFAYTIY